MKRSDVTWGKCHAIHSEICNLIANLCATDCWLSECFWRACVGLRPSYICHHPAFTPMELLSRLQVKNTSQLRLIWKLSDILGLILMQHVLFSWQTALPAAQVTPDCGDFQHLQQCLFRPLFFNAQVLNNLQLLWLSNRTETFVFLSSSLSSK